MIKKASDHSKNTKLKLLSITCTLILLISLFSFTALAEDTGISGNVSIENKISTAVSLKTDEVSSTDKIPVIIMLNDQTISFNTVTGKTKIESQQKNVITTLNNLKATNEVQDIKSIKIVNAVAAKVTPDSIAEIAKLPEVSTIELDEVVSISEPKTGDGSTIQSIAWGVDKIRAPAVWQKGITGKGIKVAVVDTGIDATHPDLRYLPGSTSPKVTGWIDYVGGKTSPYDDHGHGTHVSGTISGTGTNGMNTGVAPGTNLIVAKVFDQSGSGYTSNTILGFEWAVTNGARVISFSGGSKVHSSAFTTAINNVVAAGVTPVIAAGNTGSGSSTINCPGDEYNSITVGATGSSDNIASFSSRGPVTLGGQTYIKPDVSAPGVNVISTIPGSSYGSMSGTSMATPHVSGTVALMLQKSPTLKPAAIKKTLESTSVDLGSAGKDNNYGSGRIDAYNAVFGSEELVADFTSNVTSGNSPLNVAFIDSSTGSPTSWKWDFGDGTTSTVKNPTHIYSKSGTYSVTLTASNAAGSNTVTKTNYITVTSVLQKPVAAFTASPTSGTNPLKVQFTDKSTNNPTSWKWNFGDGSATSTTHNPLHTYIKAGTHTVTLTATNAAGSSTVTKTAYITVTGSTTQKPVAAFTASPTSGTNPLKVQFTDKSTNNPTSWKWNFGDGSATSTTHNPLHTYIKAGTYTVTLTATNAAGSSTVTKTAYITVKNPVKPVAAFTASPTSGTKPLKVQFTDKSTGSPTSWKWDFGDGTTSTTHNPLHTYIKTGKLTVKLTVKNAAGSSTKTMTSYITVK